jgi:hypothetical protein
MRTITYRPKTSLEIELSVECVDWTKEYSKLWEYAKKLRRERECIRKDFIDAITLLRELADLQNGVPLVRWEDEYNEVMSKTYDFLEANE